mmetsp:Transcript_275/g.698  ORF Transcript_275/g.698 Transcript_275/m.698 type:complete len:595 (+) Transcript_275:1056-2840(+)
MLRGEASHLGRQIFHLVCGVSLGAVRCRQVTFGVLDLLRQLGDRRFERLDGLGLDCQGIFGLGQEFLKVADLLLEAVDPGLVGAALGEVVLEAFDLLDQLPLFLDQPLLLDNQLFKLLVALLELFHKLLDLALLHLELALKVGDGFALKLEVLGNPVHVSRQGGILLLCLLAGCDLGLELLLEVGHRGFQLLLHVPLLQLLEHRLDLAVQSPPRPVPEHHIRPDVTLDDTDGLVVADMEAEGQPGELATAVRLEANEHLGQNTVAFLFESRQHAGAEEDFGVPEAVLALVEFEGLKHVVDGLARVDKALRDGARSEDLVPLPEVGVLDSVREALADDADPFEDTTAPQLVNDERGVENARLLQVVGLDAPHKVGGGRGERLHELLELVVVDAGDGPQGAAVARRDVDRGRYRPERLHKRVGRLFEQGDNVVVEWIAVLEEPALNLVHHLASVVPHGKVALHPQVGRLVRLDALLVLVVLLEQRLVGGCREDGLLVQDGEQTAFTRDAVDGGLQVQPKVDEGPLDPFALVLLLLEHKHPAVEQLLQLLVCKVDEQLLERVLLKDLKAGNVEDADEVLGGAALGLVERLVDPGHNP